MEETQDKTHSTTVVTWIHDTTLLRKASCQTIYENAKLQYSPGQSEIRLGHILGSCVPRVHGKPGPPALSVATATVVPTFGSR
jgi:hypothetical protein